MNYKPLIAQNKLKEMRIAKGISNCEKGTAIPNIINLFKLSKLFKKLAEEIYPMLK